LRDEQDKGITFRKRRFDCWAPRDTAFKNAGVTKDIEAGAT
jgi:hypothetical protein